MLLHISLSGRSTFCGLFWAVLGASVLPHSVPPSSLNLSYLSEPVSRQGSHGRSAQSHHRCNITAPAVHNGTQYGLPSHGGGSREAVVEGNEEGSSTPS